MCKTVEVRSTPVARQDSWDAHLILAHTAGDASGLQGEVDIVRIHVDWTMDAI